MNFYGQRPNFKKFYILMALLLPFCLLVWDAPQDSEAASKKVRVGYFSFPGFNDRDADGDLSGYGYEYLREIAKHTGWQYEFVTEMPEINAAGQPSGRMIPLSYDDALYWLERGELDIVGSVHMTRERAAKYAFPNHISGINYAVLSTRDAKDAPIYNDISQLSGLTVGMITGSSRNAEFAKFCRENQIGNITLKSFDNLSDLLAALHETKSVDAILTSSLRKITNERIITTFNPSPYYFIASKGNDEILQGLNAALKQIKISAPYYEQNLYEKYYADSGVRTLLLTQEEMDYIRAHPIVRISVSSNFAPLESMKDGIYKGIVADVLRLLEKKTGFQFEYVAAANYAEVLQHLKSGQSDVASIVRNDYKWGDSHNITPTKYFLSAGLSAISNKHVQNFGDPTLTVASLRARDTDDTLVGHYKKINYYDTLEECLYAVRNGDADLFLTNTYTAERIAKSPEYSALNYSTLPKLNDELSLGISNTADPMLLRILNKAIYTLSSSEISQCINENTLYYKSPTTLKNLLYQYPIQSVSGILFSLCALTVLSYYLYRNQQNKKYNAILQQKNADLEMAIRMAEEANLAKSNFLSKMSHEIRTPLNAITGLSALAECHAQKGGKMQDLLRKIRFSSAHLLSLINDILDISKIESKHMRIVNEPFHISELIHSLSSIYESQADARKIRFSIETRNIEEDCLFGDALRLNQILINFLSNALKFTPESGCITLTIEQQKKTADAVWMRFSVTDTGIGISDEKKEKIFEAFEQEDSTTTQRYGGTGLGLSIARALVDLMGGKLHLESQKGKGSTFAFELDFPIAQASAPATKTQLSDYPRTIDLSGKRILLVEDNELNTEIATELLSMTGVAIETAENGMIALERFAASAPGYYDLILMDVQMPVLNGYDATKRIRALERPDAANICIFAMTANAFVEDVQSATDAGMNGHIAKPIDIRILYTTLQEALADKQP